MRIFRRLPLPALALAAGVAGASCGKDSGTGPSGPPPSVTLTPQLDVAARRAAGAIDAFDLGVESARLVLRAGAEMVLDTVVTRATAQAELPLTMALARRLATAELDAQLELRHGSTTVFSGTGSVSAAENAGAASLVLRYVGPGAEVAQVRIAERDARVQAGATLPFTATATGTGAQPVTLGPVRWAILGDTTGTITPAGAFTAGGRRADGRVVVQTPSGAADTVALRVLPPAQTWVVVSGVPQEAPAGRALAQPIVLELRATDGLPLDGVEAVFSTRTADAGVAPARDTTDAQGRVELHATLGRELGTQRFVVSGGGLGQFEVTATATVGFSTTIAADSGDAQQGTAGEAATPLVVRVLDETGQPVAGATVTFAVTAGTGTLAATTATTDGTGRARVGYTHATTAGAGTVTATLVTASGPVTATFALTARAGAVARLVAIDTTTRVDTVMQTHPLPLAVRAEDRHGNAVAGVPLRWRVTQGSVAVDTATTLTGTDGTAGRTLRFGSRTTTARVTVSPVPADTLLGTVTFAARSVPAAPTQFYVWAGSNQSAPAGGTLPVAPEVQVVDPYGNFAVGATVTFEVIAGGGSVAGATAVVDSTGIARSAGWTIGVTGPQRLRVTAPNATTVAEWHATVIPGAPYGVMVPDGWQDQVASYGELRSTSVQVVDVHGNRVQTAADITYQVAAGGGTLRATPTGTAAASVTVRSDTYGSAWVYWTLGTSGAQQLRAFMVGGTGDTVTLRMRGMTAVVAGDASTDYSTRLKPGADTASVLMRVRVLDGTTGLDSVPVYWQPEGNCWIIGPDGSSSSQSWTRDGGYATARVMSYGFGIAGTCRVTANVSGRTVQLRAFFAPAGARLRWTGAVSTAWTTAGNWVDAVTGANGTPTAGEVIWVPKFAVRQPQLPGATTVRGLVLDDSTSLNQAGFALTVDSTLIGGYQATLTGGPVTVGSATHAGQVRINSIGGALTLGGATCAPGELQVTSYELLASTSVTVRCPTAFRGTRLTVGTAGLAATVRFQTIGSGSVSLDPMDTWGSAGSIGVYGHVSLAGAPSVVPAGSISATGNVTLGANALQGGANFILNFGAGTAQTLAINGAGNTLGRIRVEEYAAYNPSTGASTFAQTTLTVTTNAARTIPAHSLGLSWYSNTAAAYASRVTLGAGVALELTSNLSLSSNTGATVNAGAALRLLTGATMSMGSGAFINGGGAFSATSGCAAYTGQITTTGGKTCQ